MNYKAIPRFKYDELCPWCEGKGFTIDYSQNIDCFSFNINDKGAHQNLSERFCHCPIGREMKEKDMIIRKRWEYHSRTYTPTTISKNQLKAWKDKKKPNDSGDDIW